MTIANLYLHEIPQGVALPAITYQRIATEYFHTAQDTIKLRRATYQFNCWAATMAGAIALAKSLETAMCAIVGTYGNFKIERCQPIDEGDMESETVNDELKRKGRRVDYEIVYKDMS